MMAELFPTAVFRRVLEILSAAGLVLFSLWNIWVFDRNMSDFAPREAEAVFIREGRYAYIRDALLKAKYKGTSIGFITNSDFRSRSRMPEDDQAWVQAQYVMLPWILVRDGYSVSGQEFDGEDPPFVIGDFWDGRPAEIPQELSTVFEAEGLVLFRRNVAK